jgi:hypothetical protein
MMKIGYIFSLLLVQNQARISLSSATTEDEGKAGRLLPQRPPPPGTPRNDGRGGSQPNVFDPDRELAPKIPTFQDPVAGTDGARQGQPPPPPPPDQQQQPPPPDDQQQPPPPPPVGGFENITADLDWGLRFNKFEEIPANMGSVASILPLDAGSYPLTLAEAGLLRDETTAISVFHTADCLECQAHSQLTPQFLLESSNVVLNHPSKDPSNPFWEELLEVMEAQVARRNGDAVSNWLTLPSTWTGLSLANIADAVHDEFPGSHHIELIKELFGGALDRTYQVNCADCAKIDRNIIPSQSSAEFIRGAVMMADLNTWAFGVIGPINFSVKWTFGRARPEEVVWAILQGQFTEGVPDPVQALIDAEFHQLETAADFTAYTEGSPCHPAFPAMHAASSAASLWMAVVMDLTPAQHCQVKALDYSIAYARTIAGVHFPTDNIVGLNIGQEILANVLPGYLEQKYGSDRNAVSNKIAQLRFDWNDYSEGECFTV